MENLTISILIQGAINLYLIYNVASLSKEQENLERKQAERDTKACADEVSLHVFNNAKQFINNIKIKPEGGEENENFNVVFEDQAYIDTVKRFLNNIKFEPEGGEPDYEEIEKLKAESNGKLKQRFPEVTFNGKTEWESGEEYLTRIKSKLFKDIHDSLINFCFRNSKMKEINLYVNKKMYGEVCKAINVKTIGGIPLEIFGNDVLGEFEFEIV